MTPAHNGPRPTSGAARLTFHQGGRLASLAFDQGDGAPRPQVGGGRRGKVLGFSQASRRRLMRRIAAVNKLASERPPAFLTLTYPREYPTDPATYRRHARAFLKRLRRRYGDRPVIWRLEFQKRGAPHFHMLVWDLEVTESRDDWIRAAWADVVDSGDSRHERHGTDLQAMKDWKRVAVYLSKYIAKRADQDGEVCEPVGRWWGVECGDLLVTEPVSMLMSVRAGIRLRRQMQNAARIHRPGGQRDRGVTTLLSDDCAVRLALYHGAHFEKPARAGPDGDRLPGRPLPRAGLAWRMDRHLYVAEKLSQACDRSDAVPQIVSDPGVLTLWSQQAIQKGG